MAQAKKDSEKKFFTARILDWIFSKSPKKSASRKESKGALLIKELFVWFPLESSEELIEKRKQGKELPPEPYVLKGLLWALKSSVIFSLIGFFFIGNILAWLLDYFPHPFGYSPYSFFPWIFGILGIGLGFTGYKEIPAGEAGQGFWFGQLIDRAVFFSGPSWWIPEILGGTVQIVSLKIITADLPMNTGANPTSDGVDMQVGAKLRYRVDRARLREYFVATEDPKGTLIAQAVNDLRALIRLLPAEAYYLTKEVKRGEEKIPDDEELKKDPKAWLKHRLVGPDSIEKMADQNTSDKQEDKSIPSDVGILRRKASEWGFFVDDFVIQDIDPPKEILKARADKQVEEAQAISEALERDKALKGVQTVVDAAKAAGDQSVSFMEAAEYDLIQRGKAKLDVKRIRGDAPDIVKAGVLAGDTNKGG